ncbi:GNAT family N-acetyltransferase [Chloroflexota bacterium]
MTHKLLLEIPTQFETERLLVRCYQAGDGAHYFAMSQRNREHLLPYERDNPARTLQSAEEAEILLRGFAAAWAAREYFFMGAYDRANGDFVAQLYIGVVKWETPEFEVGYFVDVAQQGQGYVTEMVRGALPFLFTHFEAHKVRLGCNDGNTRSWRVAERCGFVREAHFRAVHRHPDDTFSGSYVYGLLRSEFEALNQGG